MADPLAAAAAATALGAGLGLSAGLAPGPLTALVLAQALRHGTHEGLKVAAAPLVTDLPIVTLTLLALAWLADATRVLASLAIAGGLYLCVLARETWRAGPPVAAAGDVQPASLRKGAIANALNPHPWIFWGTVGGPTILRAAAESLLAAAGFVLGFYALLVGSKAAMAVAAGRYRHAIAGRTYRWVMRTLGVLLLAFAALLVADAVRLLRGG